VSGWGEGGCCDRCGGGRERVRRERIPALHRLCITCCPCGPAPSSDGRFPTGSQMMLRISDVSSLPMRGTDRVLLRLILRMTVSHRTGDGRAQIQVRHGAQGSFSSWSFRFVVSVALPTRLQASDTVRSLLAALDLPRSALSAVGVRKKRSA
jgi:hypothetical protein